MNFKLVKKGSTKALVTYQILDSSTGDVRGSVSIPPQAESDLLRHWAGPTGNSPAAKPQGMAAALLANRRKVSRAAILRGCN